MASEHSGELVTYPAHAFASLVDVAAAQESGLDEVQHDSISSRSCWLHQVGRERVPVAQIGVHDPKAGVESHLVAGDRGFGFEERVGVVEYYVDGAGGFARAALFSACEVRGPTWCHWSGTCLPTRDRWRLAVVPRFASSCVRRRLRSGAAAGSQARV